MNYRTSQGTPTYHSRSALCGQAASASVARRKPTPRHIARENQKQAFRLGLMLGFSVAALVFGLVMLLWVIPTMDAAVATAQGMVA